MTLEQLVQVPDDQRDHAWDLRFFDALAGGKLKVLSPESQQGPDGWPYLLTETAEDATEPAAKIIHWLAQKGIGLVVNPTKGYPDFVFNYGMLWHFKQFGLFARPQSEVQTGSIVIEKGQRLQAGAPSEEYLPTYVREILRTFFRDQGLFGVKILVMSQDQKHYDLVFSVESLGNPPQKEHQGIGEAISWFMPPHYSLMLASEKDLPPFEAL